LEYSISPYFHFDLPRLASCHRHHKTAQYYLSLAVAKQPWFIPPVLMTPPPMSLRVPHLLKIQTQTQTQTTTQNKLQLLMNRLRNDSIDADELRCVRGFLVRQQGFLECTE
jgi:hypothetical protein